MKHPILILAVLFFITNCAEDEAKQQENVIIKNGIISYYPSAVDICTYIIQMENNHFYTLENFNKEFKYYDLMLKIYYTKTDKILSCGFGGLLEVINIINVEKITENKSP